MRLIDADAMTADLLTVAPQFGAMIHWCLTVLDAQPTVDAVEVIRCKECKYWRSRKYEKHLNAFLSWCGFSALQRRENDFCNYAERRQDVQNKT